uniref:Arginase n=1 Tax=Hippocampus comes TaxID=109280 RepID=A0A3Q3DNG4_HIPCM
MNLKFYHQTVTSAQIENYLSLKTGKDLSAFFEQYLRTTMIPTLEYEYNGKKLKYRYTNTVVDFDMPIRIFIDDKEHWLFPEKKSAWKTERIKENPKTIQTIGGDCGLEIVPVSFLNKKYPNLGVIWFDAHADINRPCDSPSCNFHGMPLRTLLGEGEKQMNPLLSSTLTASQIHYVGLRDIDATEQDRIDKDGLYATKKVDIRQVVDVLKKKQITQLYLHFDFDCLDPMDYDKTYYQVPDGISIKDSVACIKALQKEFKVMGSSVLESVTTNEEELGPITEIIRLLMT